MKIEHKKDAIIMVNERGEEIAALEYREVNNVYHLMSTYVNPAYRGQGLAGELMEEMIALLKEKDAKISPVCGYAVKYFSLHPEFKELLDR